MRDRGLLADFSPAAVDEVNRIRSRGGAPVARADRAIRDLTDLPWCSIDNDDSRDLDQLSVAVDGRDGITSVLIAIADVDALVKPDTALDAHAAHNTTSVYTAAQIFPMLPAPLHYDPAQLLPLLRKVGAGPGRA